MFFCFFLTFHDVLHSFGTKKFHFKNIPTICRCIKDNLQTFHSIFNAAANLDCVWHWSSLKSHSYTSSCNYKFQYHPFVWKWYWEWSKYIYKCELCPHASALKKAFYRTYWRKAIRMLFIFKNIQTETSFEGPYGLIHTSEKFYECLCYGQAFSIIIL